MNSAAKKRFDDSINIVFGVVLTAMLSYLTWNHLRTSNVEMTTAVHESKLYNLDAKLNRMEDKIDRLLERPR